MVGDARTLGCVVGENSGLTGEAHWIVKGRKLIINDIFFSDFTKVLTKDCLYIICL